MVAATLTAGVVLTSCVSAGRELPTRANLDPRRAPIKSGPVQPASAHHLAVQFWRHCSQDNPLCVVRNVEVLSIGGQTVPKTRRELKTHHHDAPFIRVFERLIRAGIVDDSTLVVNHTGHGIPLASKLVEYFGSDVSLYLPLRAFEGAVAPAVSFARLQSQAQTYAPLIASARRRRNRAGVSTIFSPDLHDQGSFSPALLARLPGMEELKKFGFKKIFVARELAPFAGGPVAYDPSLFHSTPTLSGPRAWLSRIDQEQSDWPKSEQLQIIVDGVDGRYTRVGVRGR